MFSGVIFIKGFALSENGDLVIQNNEIQMVENDELTRQTIQTTIGTKKGEWFINWEQGVDFANILGKGVTDETVQAEIDEGVQQVDETLHISDFNRSVEGRHSKTTFKAISEESDTEIEVIKTWD